METFEVPIGNLAVSAGGPTHVFTMASAVAGSVDGDDASVVVVAVLDESAEFEQEVSARVATAAAAITNWRRRFTGILIVLFI